MKMMLAAAAVAVAVPAAAHAQQAPKATEPAGVKMACCEKMQHAEGCGCCKGMSGGAHSMAPGHPQKPKQAAPAKPHRH